MSGIACGGPSGDHEAHAESCRSGDILSSDRVEAFISTYQWREGYHFILLRAIWSRRMPSRVRARYGIMVTVPGGLERVLSIGLWIFFSSPMDPAVEVDGGKQAENG